MLATTPEFRAAYLTSHVAAVRVTIREGSATLGQLDFSAAAVTCDCTREGALRTLSMTLTPGPDVFEWVTTAGAEIFVERGIVIAGEPEYIPMGVYVIDGDVEEDISGEITLDASDRSQRISRARWTHPHTVAKGTEVGAALTKIIKRCWPACPIGASVKNATKKTGAKLTYLQGSDSDPWKDARALADSAGYRLVFDARGVAQIRESPDPRRTTPCARYAVGEGSVITQITRRSSMARSYNGVIVEGKGSGVGTPKRAEAWDTNPASPTYVHGPMGRVPMFYSSPLLTTTAQCATAAKTRLARVLGRIDQSTIQMVPHPAHEADDVIYITLADGSVGRFAIDSIVTPLDSSGPMELTTREERIR